MEPSAHTGPPGRLFEGYAQRSGGALGAIEIARDAVAQSQRNITDSAGKDTIDYLRLANAFWDYVPVPTEQSKKGDTPAAPSYRRGSVLEPTPMQLHHRRDLVGHLRLPLGVRLEAAWPIAEPAVQPQSVVRADPELAAGTTHFLQLMMGPPDQPAPQVAEHGRIGRGAFLLGRGDNRPNERGYLFTVLDGRNTLDDTSAAAASAEQGADPASSR